MAWERSSEKTVSSIYTQVQKNGLDQIIMGTSPGTGNTSTRIKLDENASAVDGAYDPTHIMIYEGTGAGQGRSVYEYDGANKFAYVGRDWKVIPDNTSKYMIVFSCNGALHVNEGLATSGGTNTITLNALASDQNHLYRGQMVFIVAGKGADQSGMCISYNGTTKVMTIDHDWIIQPDNTSVYLISPFPGFTQGRPDVNSTTNILERDVIGNKEDFVQVPYTFGIQSIMAHLNTAYYHVHGKSFVYPDHANDVTLTAGTGAWDLTGAIIEVIPEGALNESFFDLHWIDLSGISANGTIQVDIYAGAIGAEVLIGKTRASRNTVQSQEGAKRVMIPQQISGTRISCRLSDSTAGAVTCTVSFEGHYYAS